MKIKTQLIAISLMTVSITVVAVTVFSFYYVTGEITNSESFKMRSQLTEVAHNIEMLNDRASEDMIFAVQNSLFEKYFELPDTQAGNVYDENDVMQFTTEQQEIKDELDKWIFNFQSKFSVDETCLIDYTGQEHTRLTFKEIASDDELSSEEDAAPFFKPSFLLKKGQVHIQFPYVSPDSERWVFAYTTPIVKNDGSKPAFYHFEMPITIFQDLVNVDAGRMYVIDPNGFIIADSDDSSVANARYNVNPQTITSFVPNEYFPSIQSVFASNTSEIMDTIKATNSGDGMFVLNGEKNYFVYEKLALFDWILVYEKPEGVALIGNATVNEFKNISIIIGSIVIIVGFFFSYFLSLHISNPIKRLSNAVSKVRGGDLDIQLTVTGSDEISELTNSFNDMVRTIQSKTILEKQISNLKTIDLKNRYFSTIGKMTSNFAHDIRTPLTVIKATFDIIKDTNNFDDDIIEKFERIDKSINRITYQVINVLDYIRNKELNFETESLKKIIDKAITSIYIPSSVKITIKPQDQDWDITCDAEGIKIVLINLIINSLQAMENKGNITIEVIKEKNYKITIQDSGPAITDDDIRKIFEPGYTIKQEVTGLGLASCKTIIDQHGGKIKAMNYPTRFEIILPIIKNSE